MRFDKKHFISELSYVFEKNRLSHLLSDDKIEKLVSLTEIMLEENEKYNLTAITDPDKIILHHYADCASLAAILPGEAKIADVGCGAGFPTLPVAILRPDVNITGIDSTAKRINYVNMAASALGLANVVAVAARAEELGKGEMRECFDIVTARAVAAMKILVELSLPLVKVDGKMIAMKGKSAEVELDEALRAIRLLGGKLGSIEQITLSSANEELSHPLIVVEKVAKTPVAYPRAFSQISKKPL